MLKLVPNQPLTFKSPDTETGACGNMDEYCLPARLNDKYCFQHRQTSCLSQMLCNNDFSESDEIIGEIFDIDAWTFDASTWYFDSYGKRLCTLDEHPSGDATYSIVDAYGLDSDCSYTLEFTITGHDPRAPADDDDRLTITLLDGSEVSVKLNGTYRYTTLNTTGEFTFTAGANWSGCIGLISVFCNLKCWDVDPLDAIDLSGEGICKTDTTQTVTVTEQTPSLTIGKYYQLYVEVTGMSAGQVEFFLGTVSAGTVTENGIFALYGVADNTTFSFVMSTEFNGCVDRLDLYQLQQDYTIKLKNAADDSVIVDLTADLVYTRDLIEFCLVFDEVALGVLIPEFVRNEVCLYLEIESPTDGDVATNGEFVVTNNSSIQDEWTFDLPLLYEASQEQVIFTGGEGYMYQDASVGGFVQGQTYYVSFDITCMKYAEGVDPDFDSFTAVIGAASDLTGGVQVWTSEDFPTQPGHYVYKVISGTDGNYFGFHFSDDTGLQRLCLDNLRITTTPCPHELYVSKCIKFQNENEGVKGFGGTKVITACNEESDSMGFDWTTGFKLQMRFPGHITAPRYATREDDTYLFSDGRRKRVFADSEKRMDLIIEAVDELTHDVFRTMLKCDVLFIENDYKLRDQYICLDTEYVPEYDKKGLNSLAEARVEIQRYDNTIFNTNCG